MSALDMPALEAVAAAAEPVQDGALSVRDVANGVGQGTIAAMTGPVVAARSAAMRGRLREFPPFGAPDAPDLPVASLGGSVAPTARNDDPLGLFLPVV